MCAGENTCCVDSSHRLLLLLRLEKAGIRGGGGETATRGEKEERKQNSTARVLIFLSLFFVLLSPSRPAIYFPFFFLRHRPSVRPLLRLCLFPVLKICEHALVAQREHLANFPSPPLLLLGGANRESRKKEDKEGQGKYSRCHPPPPEGEREKKRGRCVCEGGIQVLRPSPTQSPRISRLNFDCDVVSPPQTPHTCPHLFKVLHYAQKKFFCKDEKISAPILINCTRRKIPAAQS